MRMKSDGMMIAIVCGLLHAATAHCEDQPFAAGTQKPQASSNQAEPWLPPVPKLEEGSFTSTLDKSQQPFRYWAPASATSEPRPLLVFLHSWSADYRQHNEPWLRAAVKRNWIFIQPDFRGPNKTPAACGSPLAQKDILDAIDWCLETFQVDTTRLYLAGASGGGHMTMLMAGRYPERFTAVSAWVPIGDLAEWYRFHARSGKEGTYAKMVAAACGGRPGESSAIDEQYRQRSPLSFVSAVGDLPVDLAAGVHDGQQGSVPIRHTIDMFNAIAIAHKASPVSEFEIEQLIKSGALQHPQPGDVQPDESYGRDIHLRRSAGAARVTIFEGAHEGIAEAGCQWLKQQQRPTHAPRATASPVTLK